MGVDGANYTYSMNKTTLDEGRKTAQVTYRDSIPIQPNLNKNYTIQELKQNLENLYKKKMMMDPRKFMFSSC